MADAQRIVTLEFQKVHALSNHLTVILGYVDLLLGDASPEADAISVRRQDLLEIRMAAAAGAALLGHRAGDPPA